MKRVNVLYIPNTYQVSFKSANALPQISSTIYNWLTTRWIKKIPVQSPSDTETHVGLDGGMIAPQYSAVRVPVRVTHNNYEVLQYSAITSTRFERTPVLHALKHRAGIALHRTEVYLLSAAIAVKEFLGRPVRLKSAYTSNVTYSSAQGLKNSRRLYFHRASVLAFIASSGLLLAVTAPTEPVPPVQPVVIADSGRFNSQRGSSMPWLEQNQSSTLPLNPVGTLQNESTGTTTNSGNFTMPSSETSTNQQATNTAAPMPVGGTGGSTSPAPEPVTSSETAPLAPAPLAPSPAAPSPSPESVLQQVTEPVLQPLENTVVEPLQQEVITPLADPLL